MARSTRDPLLDAAVALVREGGIAALTTDTLATKARVSKTTVYKRFTTKTDVLAATLDYLDWLPDVADAGDLRTELASYHQDRKRFYGQRGVRRVLAAVMAASAGDDATRRAAGAHLKRQLTVPRDILARARRRGELASAPSDDTLVTVLCGAAYYRAVVEGRPLDAEFLDQLVGLVLAAARPEVESTPRVS